MYKLKWVKGTNVRLTAKLMEENTGEKSHNNEFDSDFSNILKAYTTKAKIKQTGLYNNNLKNVPNAINTVKREPKCGIQTTWLIPRI